LPDPVDAVDTAENSAVRACRVCEHAPAAVAAACPHLPGEVPWRGEDVTAVTPPQRRTVAKSRADALVAMSEQQLITGATPTAREEREPAGLPGLGGDRYQLVVHFPAGPLPADASDDDTLDGTRIEGGPRLHPAVGRRVSCGCPYQVQIDDSAGNPLHLGRKTRRIRGRLARVVHHRDAGHCQAPGCSNPTTEIHHVAHWADGGPTCLRNLISLCDAHHWLVHDGGWAITGHSPATWAFQSSGGRAFRATPTPAEPVAPLRPDPDLRPDAITGNWDGHHLNLHDAAEALTNLRNLH
jgi:hypothetical protein